VDSDRPFRETVSVTDGELARLFDLTISALDDVTEEDWSVPAGTLDWTCWQTIDHMIDCLFSYAMQVGARAQCGYLPFNELHAKPSAMPVDLVSGLRGVMAMLLGVIRDSPVEMVASDGAP
jgi:hypothetical protein